MNYAPKTVTIFVFIFHRRDVLTAFFQWNEIITRSIVIKTNFKDKIIELNATTNSHPDNNTE